MGILSTAAKRVAKAASKQTAGQKKIAPATKGQRVYARGQIKGAAAGAAGMAGLAGLGIAELRSRLKEAETNKERAQIQAAIEKTLRQMSEEEGSSSKVNQSPRPKARPEGMAKGGAVHRMPDGSMMKGAKHGYNKGGYANCGASMKATQKSTMACGGMVHKKK